MRNKQADDYVAFNDNRIQGIDYLRAIMSVFVVIWHMGGGGSSLIFSEDHFLEHTFTFSDLVNFQILTLAVPTFIFVSIFLYAFKSTSESSLFKQLKRLLILVTFWPVAFIIFNYSYMGLKFLVPHSVGQFVMTVLTAANSIYYFFVSLIICTLLTHLVARLGRRIQITGFVVTTLLLGCLPTITKATGFYELSAHWNPLNFIPLSFAAVLVAQNMEHFQSGRKKLIAIALALFVLLSLFEWRYDIGDIFFPGQGSAIPSYTRASLIFGVLALAGFALSPSIRTPLVIKFMASYSLSLYCLHVFLKGPVHEYLLKATQNFFVVNYVSILLVILSSYGMAMILRIYLRQEVIF